MKTKKLLWVALSMTAALMMTACSSDDNDMTEAPVAPSTTKTIPYTVTVGGDAASTRATVDSDNKTLRFATGDKLYITGTDIQGVLDLEAGDEGKTSGATFSGELEYSGSGSPASDLELTATLVSAQQTVGTQVSVDDAGAVTVNYPTAAYCATISDAVQQYSRLTGTSTYGAKAFTLTQQTAFLNFEITVTGGTSGTTLPANVISGGASIAKANVTTVNDGGVKAKFVLPVAVGTSLTSATVKLGGIEISTAIGDATLSSGKVYNVKRTMSGVTLANAFTDDAVVSVEVNTANSKWFGVTGKYNAGTYATTKSGSSEPISVSMTKDGNNLLASVTTSDNTMTVTFDTTNNTYTVSEASSDDPTSLYCITINGVDITGQLTKVTPAASSIAVTWNFSEMASPYYDSVNIVETDDPFKHGGVKLSFSGGGICYLDLGGSWLGMFDGTATFTAPDGKKFVSIVITADRNVDIEGFGDWDGTVATWEPTSGGETSFSFSGEADGISTIVFNLADE